MEKQLRHIYESSSAGLFLLDINGNIISYNPTLLKVLHCTNKPAQNITGEYFASLFIKEKDEFQQMLNNALQTEQLQAQDFSLQLNQKLPIWLHCVLSKLIDSFG